MAIALRDHVWVIPSADAGPNAITTETVLVDAVRWVGATTAGHTAVIESNSPAAAVWVSIAATTPSPDQESRVDFRLQSGFKVTTLSSGTLYIYGKLSITS